MMMFCKQKKVYNTMCIVLAGMKPMANATNCELVRCLARAVYSTACPLTIRAFLYCIRRFPYTPE